MTAGHFRQTGICLALCVLPLLADPGSARAQPQEPKGTAEVHGYVRDSTRQPVANATVFLEIGTGTHALGTPAQSTKTDSEGRYHFTALSAGAYTLRAEMIGYDGASVGPVNVAPKETAKIDLFLASRRASELPGAGPRTPAAEKPAQAPEFFDEPQFTVAGVTQATNSGGHGSDTVLRTTEALAKSTLSLTPESGGEAGSPTAATENSLRHSVASNPKDSALHHRLGDVEEKLGHPLEAVREYQRAAELDPSETNLFDWGTELLAHRAPEPATEVFAKGNRLFPKSVRMLVALGVAWYARGSYEQAVQCLVSASDLDPDNPTPYLFLGRMQSVEATPSPESVERLARFAQTRPENVLANYYYAVGLWKQSSATDHDRSERVESLLLKAIDLDPKHGAAYVQLGIIYSQREDFSRAISAYQKGIEFSPDPGETLEEAHYRLAQVYLRTGEKTKAQQQLELRDQTSKKLKQDTERARTAVQQFVIALRDTNSVSPPQP